MVDLVQGTVRIKSSFSSDPIQVPGSNHQSPVSRRRSVGTPADTTRTGRRELSAAVRVQLLARFRQRPSTQARRTTKNVYNSLGLNESVRTGHETARTQI